MGATAQPPAVHTIKHDNDDDPATMVGVTGGPTAGTMAPTGIGGPTMMAHGQNMMGHGQNMYRVKSR